MIIGWWDMQPNINQQGVLWKPKKWFQLIQKVLLYIGWLWKLNKLVQAKIQIILLQQRIHLSCVIQSNQGCINGYVINYAKFNRPNKHLRKIKKKELLIRQLLIRQWVLQKIQILTIFWVIFHWGALKISGMSWKW